MFMAWEKDNIELLTQLDIVEAEILDNMWTWREFSQRHKELLREKDRLATILEARWMLWRTVLRSELPSNQWKTFELSRVSDEKVKKTISNIWEHEFRFFVSFFKFRNDWEVIAFIESSLGQVDWVIWQKGLSILYQSYYFWNDIKYYDQDLQRFKWFLESQIYTFDHSTGFADIANSLLQELYARNDISRTLIKIRYLTFMERKLGYKNWEKYVKKSYDKSLWRQVDAKFWWYSPELVFSRMYLQKESNVKRHWDAIIDARVRATIPYDINQFMAMYWSKFWLAHQNWNAVFILPDSTWKFTCIYYENWRLKLACYVSPWQERGAIWSSGQPETWRWSNSPRNFIITQTIRVSHEYIYKWKIDRDTWLSHIGPMPSARWTNVEWIYFHEWEVTAGYASRWCFRLDWFFANIFSRIVQSWTPWYFRPEGSMQIV